MCVSNLTLTVAYLQKLPLVLWLPATLLSTFIPFPCRSFRRKKKTCRWQFRNTTTCTIISIYQTTSGYFFKSLPPDKVPFLCSIAADLLVNPCEEILHPGVHTVLAFISASNTPACDTMKTVQPRSILAHHWSAAISLAWIHSPFSQSCTNHWCMNTVLLISLFACTLTYHRNGRYLQLVWLISTRRQCTPTCDNTRISNNWITRW